MKRNPIEAKINKIGSHSTVLFIRAGDSFIQSEFSELAACEFPMWTSSPICVEIPPNGAKDFIAGPSMAYVPSQVEDHGYPHTIKFPVYQSHKLIDHQAYQNHHEAKASGENQSNLIKRIPIVAIATSSAGIMNDGKLIQMHSVLPVWNDGSSVLVTLDWFEGEPAEGTPNGEWHMRASSGMPVVNGMRKLAQMSKLPAHIDGSRYSLCVSPWLLGARMLGNEGNEVPHKIWQREWRFSTLDSYENALDCITDSLLASGIEETVAVEQ